MLPGAIERIFAFVNGPTGKHGPQRQVKSGGYDRCYDPAENQIREIIGLSYCDLAMVS